MSDVATGVLIGCALGGTFAITIIIGILLNIYDVLKVIKAELLFSNNRRK